MNLNDLLSKINVKADWIGLRSFQEQSSMRRAKNGILEPLQLSYDRGIMVEVLVDGQLSYAGTCDPSPESLQKTAQRAVHLAHYLKDYRLFEFDTTVRPPSKGSYKTLIQKRIDPQQDHHLNELAVRLSQKMKKSDHIINAQATLFTFEQQMSLVSSQGTNISQHISQRALELSATALTESEIQTRSNGFTLSQEGDEFFDENFLTDEAARISSEAIALTKAEECPSGQYDLLLMPDQLYLQIHESIGHPLELDRIMGDERNYAGWSFIKLEDFGTLQYGSNLLNVTFDPLLPHELASYRFDDTGAASEKHFLIEKGLLKRGLGSLESQNRSQVAGVSSSRATSWNRPPIDRMANINIVPGSSTLDEMILSTERGILMKTNKSWSIDDYRNKFQFGCEYGQMIEKGKLTKIVKNPNYRGITTPFWHKLKMVGDHSTFEVRGSLYCGKGEPNQVIRVGHATPACLFRQVEVFGGGVS